MSKVRASLVHTITAHQGDVNGLSLSTKILATCSSDKTVRLWSLDDFTELTTSPLLGHTYHVHYCEFSPFGTTLATCSTDGKIILWDMKCFEKITTFQHPSNQCVRVCRFSPNSCLLATGSDDMTLCLWDVGSKALLKVFEGHETSVVAVAFTCDAAYLVSGSKNGDLRVWDARYHRKSCLHLELHGHDLGVTACSFSPQHIQPPPGESGTHYRLLTSGYDNSVKLWSLIDTYGKGVSLKLTKVLLGHSAPVLSSAFSTDGRLIASASGDKTIRLWNPETGQCYFQSEGHSRYVTSCSFSPCNQYLASGSSDRNVAIWRLLAQHEHEPPPIEGAHVIDLSDDAGVLANNKEWLTWNIDQVCNWLDQIGLGLYKEAFQSNAIDGQELDSLTDESLSKSLGIPALGHRNKILRAIKNLGQQSYVLSRHGASDTATPHEFLCPITCEIMKDPVIVSDGYTYERAAIMSWLGKGKKLSPMTNAPLANNTLTPNRGLKLAIQRHLQTNV